MPRHARVVVPDIPHHVCQRGNRGVDVFHSDAQCQRYLIWLADYADRYGLAIWAYCLMSNHVHIVAVPANTDALALVMRPLQTRHAQQVNADSGTRGHLWHGRYYSCPLDGPHLRAAVRYVERNPLRAGLVQRAEEYDWSSARTHCGLRPDPVLAPDMPLLAEIGDWSRWLSRPQDEDTLNLIRDRTEKGLPCGSARFVEQISAIVGRNLQQRPVGRPGSTPAAAGT